MEKGKRVNNYKHVFEINKKNIQKPKSSFKNLLQITQLMFNSVLENNIKPFCQTHLNMMTNFITSAYHMLENG